MSVAPGTTLGPYEILSPLGAGGMGEVYRARDTRLGREVALKILPEAVSQDAERLRRFQTEARSASDVNHPNLLTVFDVGEHVARIPRACTSTSASRHARCARRRRRRGCGW